MNLSLILKRCRETVLTALVVGVTGCGSAPVQHDINNNFDFPRTTYEDIWNATVAVLSSANLAPESMDREAGVMSSGWTGLPESQMDFADCGDAGLAYSFRNLEVNVNPVLSEQGGSVTLTINTRFRADRWEGGLAQRVVEENRTCFSTGELEQLIRDRVQADLRGG